MFFRKLTGYFKFIAVNGKVKSVNYQSHSMKILITILGFLNGAYMLLDGIFVTIKGKYLGPEKPGPWAELFYKLNVDVFKLGALFIVFGVLWLCWLIALWTRHRFTYRFGIVISILTLWYLPVGTIFSITILLLLIFRRNKI